ncbi:class I SAM-dependent methyltransferase [Pseudooceanicola sp.]|uniref:class I SAM-dependent methyltransferase n=1 Tax=Pseudooceanicola sp. TaxID=1914328 RepID=UPI0035C78176
MVHEFDAADALQAELAERTAALAAVLRIPPTDREPGVVQEGWKAVDAYRSRMNATQRHLSRIDRTGDRLARLGNQVVRHGTRRYLRNFSARLKMWEAMEAMIARHADPDRVWLLQERPDHRNDPLLRMLHMALHGLANTHDQSDEAEKYGCFADIPMPLNRFETLMRGAYRVLLALGRTGSTHFLDVGCGGGIKTFLASRYHARSDGLDYDADYVAAATRTLAVIGRDRCRAFQADGLTFDGYDAYDVIYFYRPMRDDALLAKLEERVFTTAAPGTLILAPYDQFLEPRTEFDCARIEGCIYMTGVTQAEADRIRQHAELTGEDIVTRAQDFSHDTGYWTPLLEAATFDIGSGNDLSGLRHGT